MWNHFDFGALAWVAIAAALFAFTAFYVSAQAVTGRLLGVGVEEVAMGFGPRLLSFRFRGIVCKLCLLPLGGYTRFAGGLSSAASAESDGTFSRLVCSQKILLLSVGPLSNIVLGVAVLAIANWVGRAEPRFVQEPARIGWCRPESALQQAGLQAGDEVIAAGCGGRVVPIRSCQDLIEVLSRASGGTLSLECRRESRVLSLEARLEHSPLMDICHVIPPILGPLDADSPATKHDFLTGDVVGNIDGMAVTHWLDLDTAFLQPKEDSGQDDSKQKQVAMTMVRAGNSLVVRVSREELKEGAERFGFRRSPEPVVVIARSVGSSLQAALVDTMELLNAFEYGASRQGKRDSVSRALRPDPGYGRMLLVRFAVGGSQIPVLIGALGLCLGLLNLIPIPTMNGGWITIACYEFFTGRPISERAQEVLTYCGLLFILLLMCSMLFW